MRPQISWNEQSVSMYAEAYHPMSFKALNWSVMRGTAVERMVLSRAMRKEDMYTENITSRMFPFDG